MNQKKAFEPGARPGSRRITICPTCSRPFIRGSGVRQGAGNPARPRREADRDHDPEFPEYCCEKCLPGLLT